MRRRRASAITRDWRVHGTARPHRDVMGACQVLLPLEPHVAWDADRHPERVQCGQHLARRGAEVVSEGQGLHDRDKQVRLDRENTV